VYRLLVDYLLVPSNWLLLATALGLIHLARVGNKQRWRVGCVAVPFLLLLAMFTPAVAYLARGSLERAYPPLLERPSEVEAIVVLGGYIEPPNAIWPRARLGWDSLSRCLHAAHLYHHGPAPCPIVVAGGKVMPHLPGPTIAAMMSDFLITQGVPADDILVETASSTTYENARETRKLLAGSAIRKIALVTDAIHLRRAAGCFQAQGFLVVPAGCNYLVAEWSAANLLPRVGAAVDIERSVHEWLGMAWYWWQGRI
jgi:uncharacterized SAM-binding protein YcdF (DUF218 family)